MRRKLLSLTAIFLCFTLLFGCSDDDDSSSDNNNTQPPAVAVQTVTVPTAMQNSSDPYAQMAVGYINLANSFSAYTANLTPPGNATVSAVPNASYGMLEATTSKMYTWNVQAQGVNITFKLTVQDDGTNYSWTLVYDGTISGITYNNQTVISATQKKDGTSGDLIIYGDPQNPTTVSLEYAWTNVSNVYTGTMTIGTAKYEVVVNPDKSGHITFWSDSALHHVFYAAWTATGSGTWATYDTNGTQTAYGTWI